MGQVLHGSATTTEAVRRAIQNSQESLRALAKRYGINQKTVAKWKRRSSVSDLPTGAQGAADRRSCRSRTRPSSSPSAGTRCCRSTTASMRCRPTIPHLTRSSLASLPAAHGIATAAGGRRRQTGQEEVQGLPDRLLPYRHCRGADRRRQAIPLRRNRPDQQVCLRPARRARPQRVTARPSSTALDQSRALQDPHRADRQWHPVPLCRHATPTAQRPGT